VAAARWRVVSANRIIATAPKHLAGRVDVHVITAGGTSPAATADRFTYLRA
jgi:hypothetical protein